VPRYRSRLIHPRNARGRTLKPAPFTRHAPKTIDEAVRILADVAPQDGRVLAGGQSLVPIMAFRLAKPAHLVDINGVAGLDRLSVENGALAIGATVRHAAFHKPVVDNPLGRLLSAVARHIAHYPIRTRGTFCGSIAHADPSSEWCLTAATLDATMVARSVRGERSIAAREFFEGLMSTALKEDELLAEVRLPLLANDAHFGFCEFSRRAGDFAMTAALATWRSENGKMRDVRIGVGGAEPSPRRIAEAEAALEGQAPGDAAFRAAAEAAANAVDAMEDHQTSAEYRCDLVRAMVRRALEQSAQ
jgi:carbon-monoxide dehydrogenase medium subunit